mmetsp:Transcript_145466/g.268231  ORF Transcript_145466/g.268231 Transcript_145466/m.268231 type:complete len:224 (-) Transcript_145466:59-730(-)
MLSKRLWAAIAGLLSITHVAVPMPAAESTAPASCSSLMQQSVLQANAAESVELATTALEILSPRETSALQVQPTAHKSAGVSQHLDAGAGPKSGSSASSTPTDKDAGLAQAKSTLSQLEVGKGDDAALARPKNAALSIASSANHVRQHNPQALMAFALVQSATTPWGWILLFVVGLCVCACTHRQPTNPTPSYDKSSSKLFGDDSPIAQLIPRRASSLLFEGQ